MAQKHARHDWEAIGQQALLDLLSERRVITWFEAESRISSNGWKHFPKVQPLQLHASRTALIASGDIIVETTSHPIPVVSIRLPYAPSSQRTIERLRGKRRKLYRKYLSWTNDQTLCGRHAELVVLSSLHSAASRAGLYVPPQTTGSIDSVSGIPLKTGPLDSLAYILDLPSLSSHVPMVVEVKNVNSWIYPWAQEIWQLLVKSASLATQTPVLPVLVCMRSAYPTFQMAKDLGFFTAQAWNQLFSPSIPSEEFSEVRDDFDLTIQQHSDSLDALSSFFSKTLRTNPPPSPPYDESIDWYVRQASRFQVMAPEILRFSRLSDDLSDQARRKAFSAFRTAAHAAMSWPAVRGW